MDKPQEKIINEYIRHLLENDRRPRSVFDFTDSIKKKESAFYKYFNSFDDLEKGFWKITFDEVVSALRDQDVYHDYSVNEKLLAFYFSWIEKLTEYRSYAKYVAKKERLYEWFPGNFELFKDAFQQYAGELVEEGLATEEIARRQMITDKYKYLLWAQAVSIFKFWVKDESERFEDTDALIEKSVNFAFDLMRSNGLDSFFDLAKFRIQHL